MSEQAPSGKGVVVSEPALLIRINQSYHDGISGVELYEATRGIWKLGPRRERARIALSVYRGTVLEVYAIDDWHPADSTPYQTRTFTDPRKEERWEFTGELASQEIRRKYVGESVASYFPRGSQTPVLYVNID